MTLGPRSNRLLSVASEPLTGAAPRLLGPVGPLVDGGSQVEGGRLVAELAELLAARNGFYAFESALHVFASGDPDAAGGSLEDWNAPQGWRAGYEGMADGYLFFAEDLFGTQFALRDERVHSFDPETGEAEMVASSIEDWADQLLADHEVLTGWPLGDTWQRAHQPLAPGLRLVPSIPFVLGGEFEVANLQPLDAARGMALRAELALLLRDVPDGTAVTFRIVDQGRG